MTTGFALPIWNEIAAFSNEQVRPRGRMDWAVPIPVASSLRPFECRGERWQRWQDTPDSFMAPATHFGRNRFSPPCYRHHRLQPRGTFSKAWVWTSHISCWLRASCHGWHTFTPIDLPLARTQLSVTASLSSVNDSWRTSKRPGGGPHWKELPELIF